MTEEVGPAKCPICLAYVPSEMTNAHRVRHLELGDLPSPKAEAAGGPIIFWGFCVLVGAFAAEAVTAIHRALS